jgi:hypothetical protein
MSKVALNISEKSVPVQILMAQNYVTKMTGNANFATPVPSLKQIQADIDDLQTTYTAALNRGKEEVEARRVSLETLLADVTALGVYVQSASGGDAGIIMSAGMDVRKPPTRRNSLGDLVNVVLRYTGKSGTAGIKWKPVKGAVAYNIQQYAEQPVTSAPNTQPTIEESNSWDWENALTTSAAKGLISGLISGTKYWFRVQAVGPNNTTSGWSNPSSIIAP